VTRSAPPRYARDPPDEHGAVESPHHGADNLADRDWGSYVMIGVEQKD